MAVLSGCFMQAVLLVVVLGSSSVLADLMFSLGSCASNNNNQEALTFTNSRVTPYPLVLPGDITVTSSLQVFRNVTGSLTLDVIIERDFGLFKVPVPCIHGIGSCQYRNVCGILRNAYGNNTGCPSALARHGVPCTCPFLPGTYTMTEETFSVPQLDTVWAWLAQGDYTATARLINANSGEEIACQRLDLTIQAPCTSFLCRIFG
ncbi:ganglioside GM2 activator-like [Babylonia areolata]|uniref:ganglioside GM2 activator-like n=1 Tax=Babylonia areolata TaxID=304850 RepID=UPI003FCF7F18